jgi:hypothetical protein
MLGSREILCCRENFGVARIEVAGGCITQFGKRVLLQSPNALPSYADCLGHMLERLCHGAIQSEPLCDDRCLTLIQLFEKSADPIGEVFPAGQFERRLRLFTWNVFPKFGHVIVANKRIERFRTQANAFRSRQFFFSGNTKLLTQLVLGRSWPRSLLSWAEMRRIWAIFSTT